MRPNPLMTLSILPFLVSGCGTFANLFPIPETPHMQVYGGVQYNLEGLEWHPLLPLLVVDTAACLVLDTVLLPLYLTYDPYGPSESAAPPDESGRLQDRDTMFEAATPSSILVN